MVAAAERIEMNLKDDVVIITDTINTIEMKIQRRVAIKNTARGIRHYLKGDYERAKIKFTQSIVAGSKNYANYYHRSESEYALNNVKAACKDARKAIAMAPRDVKKVEYKCHVWLLEIKLSMCDILFCQKLVSKIKRVYRRQIDQNFKDIKSKYIKLCHCLSRLVDAKNPDEAIEHCSEAIKLAPKASKLYLKKAHAYLQGGKYYDARSACVEALKYDEDDGLLARSCQFRCMYLSGSLIETIMYLKRILAENIHVETFQSLLKDIESLESVLQSVKRFVSQSQYALAKDGLFKCINIITSSDALKHNKFEADCCLKLGAIFKEEGNNAEALFWINKATNLDKNSVKAFTLQGDIEREEGRYSEAQESYRAALALDNFCNDELEKKLYFNSCLWTKIPNYYEVLGVNISATERTIKSAYKAAALKYHPDKHRDATNAETQVFTQQFNKVCEGYKILLDPVQRNVYDMIRKNYFGEPLWDVSSFFRDC